MKYARRATLVLAAMAFTLLLTTTIAFAIETWSSRGMYAVHPPRGEFVTVRGARMNVICRGEATPAAPALVFQAGIAGGALDWLPLMDVLDDSYRVCAFDRFGQDWSDPAPAPRAFGTAAEELHLALRVLGIDAPVIVGHSLGGAVAQIYAAEYEVSGLILIDGLTLDAAPVVTQRLASYQALDWLAPTGLLRPMAGLFADRAYPDALRAEMRALRGQAHVLRQITAEGALAHDTAADELAAAETKLTAPLLVIAAGNNGLPEGALFLAGLRRLAKDHPSATYYEIPDASHYLIASHAEEIGQIVGDWLRTN